MLLVAALVVIGGVWFALSQTQKYPHRDYNLPKTANHAAQDIAETSGPAIIYDTELKPIAPTDALAINAARPDDITKVVPATAFTINPPSKDDAHFAAAMQCLAQAIYYEAGGEGEPGQRAVAQVVVNRVRSLAFPNTVCGVVYQGAERVTGCQFTFTCDGSLARTPSQAGFDRALKVARQALSGKVDDVVGNATHYHANFVVPYWASSLDKVKTIGAHIFYLIRGPLGSPGAFREHYNLAYETLPASLAGEGAELAVQPTDMPTQSPENRLLVAPLAPALTADANPGRLVHTPVQPSSAQTAAPSRLRADQQSGTLKAGNGSSRLIVDGQSRPEAADSQNGTGSPQ